MEQGKVIADDSSNDLLVTDRGVQANNAAVRRAELRVSFRERLAEKMNPTEYAPKQRIDITQRSVSLNVQTTPAELQAADSTGLLKALESME